MRQIAVILMCLILLTGCAGLQGPTPSEKRPPVAPQVAEMPSPDQLCLKPEDDSSIIISLHRGNSDSTLRIKPGWTIPFHANWFIVAVKYPETVDRESVQVKVEPAYWETERRDHPGADTFSFAVLPEGKQGPGAPGWITVTVDGAKRTDGTPLQEGPVSFRLWAYEALKPGESLPPCPGLEVPPPDAPTPPTGEAAERAIGRAAALVDTYLKAKAAGEPVDHLLAADADLSLFDRVKPIQYLGAQPFSVEAGRIELHPTVRVELHDGSQTDLLMVAVVVRVGDEWKIQSMMTAR